MYDFRTLKAEYILSSSIEKENTLKSSLDIVYTLEARYQNIEDKYHFIIDRKAVLIHARKKESEKLVDQLMQKLGDIIYPVVLIVSKQAKILGIKNFKEIQARWDNLAGEILHNSYSVSVKKYIEMARSNIVNEKAFINAFCRQTFILLAFRDREDRFFWLNTYNLANVYSNDLVKCEMIDENNSIVLFESVGNWNTECSFEYVFSELGDILSVKGVIKEKSENSIPPITKKVSLYIRDNKRAVRRSNKLTSFLID